MTASPVATRRARRAGLVVFLALAVLCCGSAGVYLALHPQAGGTPFVPGTTSRRPDSVGLSYGTARQLVRTSSGVEFADAEGAQDRRRPEDPAIGSVSFLMNYLEAGWPKRHYLEWTLTIQHVQPDSAGPDARDQVAWRALVIQALRSEARPLSNREIPDRLATASGPVRVRKYAVFVANTMQRLWECPSWIGECLVLAAVGGAAAWWWAYRRRSGDCVCDGCGYDLAGIPGSVCPECGAGV